MKQRSTFLVRDPAYSHPSNFGLTPTSLRIKAVPAAREDRLTFGVDELPAELRTVLRQCAEVHVRWTSRSPYTSTSPYGARVPAGLSVFVVPHRHQQGKGAAEAVPDGLCRLLAKAFGAPSTCIGSFGDAFLELPTGTFQFYAPATDASAVLQQLHKYLSGVLCIGSKGRECERQLAPLERAVYVDVDYDAVAQTLVSNAFWAEDAERPWDETITQRKKDDTNIEIGILGQQSPMEEESFTMAGFVYTIGESKNLEPMLFTFPARHHRLPGGRFSAHFTEPTGLHPTLQVRIRSPLGISPPALHDTGDCTLNAAFTLPRSIFVDAYQLAATDANTLLLRSLNMTRLRDLRGETDLEAPVWVPTRWGSSALAEVRLPRSVRDGNGEGETEKGGNEERWADGEVQGKAGRGFQEEEVTLSLPLHLRYHDPALDEQYATTGLPWPTVFWACRAEQWNLMAANPFDRSHLGWEHAFPQQTMYYHFSPEEDATAAGSGVAGVGNDGTWAQLDVPVLDLRYAPLVSAGTVVVVGLGFLWVLWKLFVPLKPLPLPPSPPAGEKEAHPKKE